MARSSDEVIEKRLERLRLLLHEDPFLTDQQLSRVLGVSVPTIRLDRLRLGIPQMRERTRRLAEEAQRPRSLYAGELFGELLELRLGSHGRSLLRTTPDMAFARTGIVRGHWLFAQANSLAVALIDADVVVTGSARFRFLRPVRVPEEVVARAHLRRSKGSKHLVEVESACGGEPVAVGSLIVAVLASGAGQEPQEVGR